MTRYQTAKGARQGCFVKLKADKMTLENQVGAAGKGGTNTKHLGNYPGVHCIPSAHAGYASDGTYGSSTTNQKSRSPSRPEWLKRRQSRPSCMDAVRGPFARNTTPNSAPYTPESCFVSSGHSARDQTIG